MASDLAQPLSALPDPLPIPPIAPGAKPFDVTIRPPGSKSITNRALLLAALADGTSTLRGALSDADDAQVMLRAIQQLGARVEHASGGTGGSPASEAPDVLRITGVNGRWKIPSGQTVHLDLHNAGTATRFLAAAALLAPPNTSIVIDGDARMRQRPIGELVDLLRAMGANITYRGNEGFPPIEIEGPTDPARLEPRHQIGVTASSQFISAVMLVAPLLPRGIFLELAIPITSRPYIAMSAKLLGDVMNLPLGWARFEETPGRTLSIRVPSLGEPAMPAAPRSSDAYWSPRPSRPLPAFEYTVEPDASGATYFQAAALLIPGSRVMIDGLDPLNSAQGDACFAELLRRCGLDFVGELVKQPGGGKSAGLRITGPQQLAPIDADLADMPDTAMTAAVLCCFAEPTPDNPTATSTLRGLRTLRVKETDRLAALQTELTKLGAKVEILRDGDDEALRITPPPPRLLEPSLPRSLRFSTYHDHRMAMALALIGLRIPGIQIENPGCVAKTYPGYWKDFARILEPPPP